MSLIERTWTIEKCNAHISGKNCKLQIKFLGKSSVKLEPIFTLPKNSRLDSISFNFSVISGTIRSTATQLQKIIKGGDLPDPRILNVGCVHIFDIAVSNIVNSTVTVVNPVFDILQPCEEIKYLFVLTFTSCKKAILTININDIIPNFTPFQLPVPIMTTPEKSDIELKLEKANEPFDIDKFRKWKPPENQDEKIPLISQEKVITSVTKLTVTNNNTTTPIKHVILVTLENVSFDNMFGTYPIAQNLPGEIPFFPLPGTKVPDNLLTIDPLTGTNYLTNNRNVGQNGTGHVNPQRLAPDQELTNFESNGYTRTQIDVHNGLMDHYVLGQKTPPPIPVFFIPNQTFDATYGQGANIVMDYWDGNSFTGLWNYAQHYAINDRCFATGYGESVVGAINWVSGNNSGIVPEFPDLLIDVRLLQAIADTFSANPQLPPLPKEQQFVKWGFVLSQLDNVVLYNWIAPKNDLSILLFLVVYFELIVPKIASLVPPVTFPGVSGIVQFAQQFTSNLICPKHKNIGDLLNKKDVTWGSFMSGWRTPLSPTQPNQIVIPWAVLFGVVLGQPALVPQLEAIIPNFNDFSFNFSSHLSANPIPPRGSGGLLIRTIVGPQPDFDITGFLYYASTTNFHVNPPSSIANVGQTDAANHNYEYNTVFFQALAAGILPAVSYIRLPAYQSGHPLSSDAYDNQLGIVSLINTIMASPFWKETAIFLQWDESNGSYDHVPPPLVRSSDEFADPKGEIARRGEKAGIKEFPLRAGYGPRIPFLLISPWAKENYISHCITDQTSIIKFIEDNWQLGKIGKCSYDKIAGKVNDMFDFNPNRTLAPKIFINPLTGLVTSIQPS